MTLLELAEEFKVNMESCCKTKNEAPLSLNREYWAGKEQAWYEAWRVVVDLVEGSFKNG